MGLYRVFLKVWEAASAMGSGPLDQFSCMGRDLLR